VNGSIHRGRQGGPRIQDRNKIEVVGSNQLEDKTLKETYEHD